MFFHVIYRLNEIRLDVLSYHVLIDRLVLHREFLLALLVCDFLHLPVSEGRNRVLFHWACFKVILIFIHFTVNLFTKWHAIYDYYDLI